MRSTGGDLPLSAAKQPVVPPSESATAAREFPSNLKEKEARSVAMSARSLVRQPAPRYRVFTLLHTPPFATMPRFFNRFPGDSFQPLAKIEDRDAALRLVFFFRRRATRWLVDFERHLEARLLPLVPAALLLFALSDLLDDERG